MPAMTTGLMGRVNAAQCRSVRSRHREPVAAAAHRLDQRVLADRLERLPQSPDVDVDRALLDVRVVAPHLVEELRPRMNALRPREQKPKQPEFRGAERNGGRRRR